MKTAGTVGAIFNFFAFTFIFLGAVSGISLNYRTDATYTICLGLGCGWIGRKLILMSNDMEEKSRKDGS